MVFLSRRLFSYKAWNAAAAEWLSTKAGRRTRILLLAGTVVAYPIGSLLTNGPLLNVSFPRRHLLDPSPLPEKLGKIIKEEYERFLERESRVPKDAVMRYDLSADISQSDTEAAGSLGVRTGLRLALPFYTKFSSVDEVIEYFRSRNADTLEYLREPCKVDWNSEAGRELAETFLLSDNALRFIVLRDFYAHDGWAAIAQRSISWSSWTAFTSLFTYWFHNNFRWKGSAMGFVVIYGLFLSAAAFSNKHWHYLYRYMTDVYADSTSAHTSFDHCAGGREFYWKQLKRNRILRDLNYVELAGKVTPSGDVRGIPTSLLTRYDHLKDLGVEDDELKQVVAGDD